MISNFYLLFLQWWNQLSRFQRTLLYVCFASILLLIIYLRPNTAPIEGYEDSSVPSPEPVENVLKAAEEAAAVVKSAEHVDDVYNENKELKQPDVQQVEEPLLPRAMEFSGKRFFPNSFWTS